MELREWQYMNKPAGSTTNNSSSGYKKRFEKLIKYHGRHPAATVEYILVSLLTNDRLEFTEHWDSGDKVEYKIYIVPETESWNVKRFVNNQLKDTLSGTGWPELLKTLRAYLTIPVTGTQEYDELLTESLNEWQLMNPPTQQTQAPASSTKGGYWERFNKLLFYHVNHKSPAVDKIIRTKVSKDGFHYTEHIRARYYRI